MKQVDMIQESYLMENAYYIKYFKSNSGIGIKTLIICRKIHIPSANANTDLSLISSVKVSALEKKYNTPFTFISIMRTTLKTTLTYQ